MKTQTGAARIVQALREGNARCAFGLPGTQTVELFEALRKSGLRTVTATSELSASFMAGGWARVAGEPGIVLTIPGPGFTWALTGLAEARLDSVPLLQISGSPHNVPSGRRFRQQEIDQTAIAAPLVKAIIDADACDDPGAAVRDALLLARSGEPGPVLVQVSATTLSHEYGSVLESAASAAVADSGALEAVRSRIARARRPVFMVGQGTNRYAPEVRDLVERMNAPLLTTPSARGVLPENHHLNFGFDPFAGSVSEVNKLIASSDLVVVIGCKLAHSGTNGFELELPQDRLVHVDASDQVVGVNYPPSLGIVADAGVLLRGLVASAPEPAAWTENELETWRRRLKARLPNECEPRIAGTSTRDARGFFEALRKALPADAILVLDSGLHQILARRHYSVLAPCGLITPTGLQSMGFAIPTAMGARLAAPDRPVVALVGDGGFAMTAMELLTAAREQIQLIVIVFVDGAFGQIRHHQLANYGVSHGVGIENPDFGLLAEAVGAHYELIEAGGVERAVRKALLHSGVTLLEVGVGDSLAIRKMAAVARTRGLARQMAWPGMIRLFRKMFRRTLQVL